MRHVTYIFLTEEIEGSFEGILGSDFDAFLEGLGNVIDVKINEVEVTFSSFEGMCLVLEMYHPDN